MLKTTLQIYSLCLALNQRNDKSFQTLEESLQNQGLNQLFKLFWSRLCQILQSSLEKISEKGGFKQLHFAFIANYPIFVRGLDGFWTQLVEETMAKPGLALAYSE